MVSAFAPVNIAWIKYMGKENGLPTNASFSMTLAQIGTVTTLIPKNEQSALGFLWSPQGYVPPETGRQKAEQFLLNQKIWNEGFQSLGYSLHWPKGLIEIQTRNNVPAGTGIATSASGFAALTLAWVGLLMGDQFSRWSEDFASNPKTREKVAALAKQGSGSAGRSFDGPWVEWNPKTGFHATAEGPIQFTDFILLIDEGTKAVSSSEAHLRVLTSPNFKGRSDRAQTRLVQVKAALKRGDLKELSNQVGEEAVDMHHLFHTAHPPFSYLKPESRAWIERVQSQHPELPSKNGILTLDAGANVHLFVNQAEEEEWEAYLRRDHPELRFLKARSGKGAHYVDTSI